MVKIPFNIQNERMSPTYAWKHPEMGKFLASKSTVFSFFFSGFINLLVPTYLPLPKTNQKITKHATTTPTLSYTFKDTFLSTLQCSLGLSLVGLSYNKMIPSPPQYWRNYRVFSSDLRDTSLPSSFHILL